MADQVLGPLRVTFVLPDLVREPVGGIKVAYEHANRLARRGHQVTIVHADRLGRSTRRRARLLRDLRFAAWQRGLGGWFRLEPRVHALLMPLDRPELLPEGDVLIAAGWAAVGVVNQAPSRAGRKHYLVQAYMGAVEGAPGEVDAVWRLPMRKIVIASWLERKVREVCGAAADVVRIPAAIDDGLGVQRPIDGRDVATVSMLYHDAAWKGRNGVALVFDAAHSPRACPGWPAGAHRCSPGSGADRGA